MEAELLALRAENDELRVRVAELEREAARLRAFFEELPVLANVFRADGVLVEVNRKAREVFGGVPREAVVGRYNILHDPGAMQPAEARHRIFAGELGQELILSPAAYDVREEGAGPEGDRQVWTQGALRGVEVGGERYAVGVYVDVTERMRAERALAESQAFLGGIIEHAPVLIFVKDREGRYLLVNAAFERAVGRGRAKLLGKTDRDLFPTYGEAFERADRAVLEAKAPIQYEEVVVAQGVPFTYFTTKFALRDSAGQPHAVCSISLDITDRKRVEAEAKRLQEEMFQVQEATLRALSTPLLPIAEGVVVMPLIGALDAQRMEQVMETLLSGIVAHRASQVIVDVTGVPMMDAQVASALVRTAQAVGLLGAQVVLTGMKPATARALVELGVDLGGMQTRGTLESGIAHALSGRGSGRRA